MARSITNFGKSLTDSKPGINPISNGALNQTFKEGLRTFFRSVYPRNAL